MKIFIKNIAFFNLFFLIILFFIFFIFFIPCVSFAEEESLSEDDIISSQKSSLNIGEFIGQAKKYTKDIFEDTDYNDLLNSAIRGNIDNEKLGKSVIKIIGRETLDSIKTIGLILIVIVIHSILKSITEELDNKSVSQIAYFVQYILIVTLIMTNFADIIEMVKESITNLVGFSDSLIPILMTLIMTTRQYCFI